MITILIVIQLTGVPWLETSIADHMSDYFDDPLVCGQALGVTTDQIIEHMHSYVNRLHV